MTLERFSDKGSGWHKQSGRHSKARLTGHAGGTYAKKPSIMTWRDEKGNLRWKHSSKKGAIYGRNADGTIQRWKVPKRVQIRDCDIEDDNAEDEGHGIMSCYATITLATGKKLRAYFEYHKAKSGKKAKFKELINLYDEDAGDELYEGPKWNAVDKCLREEFLR